MMIDQQTIHLSRKDPARNMARFYALEITPDLFGGVILIRNWGRIGHRGQELREWYPAEVTALKARDLWRGRKRHRGYDETE